MPRLLPILAALLLPTSLALAAPPIPPAPTPDLLSALLIATLGAFSIAAGIALRHAPDSR